MIVGIHQPNYLPWLGYFRKIARCDRFIFLDDVQYVRRGFVNRNRIKTSQGPTWLTVPVEVKGRYTARINEMMPCWETPWVRQHLRTLELNYARAPYYGEVMSTVIAPVLREAESIRSGLAWVNTALIRRICEYLGIETPFVYASGFSVPAQSTDRLIELTHRVGGTAYLSGAGGDDYQDPKAFSDAGIDLLYNFFEHPCYTQLWGPFEPNLSIVDALFCCGRSTAAFLGVPGAPEPALTVDAVLQTV